MLKITLYKVPSRNEIQWGSMKSTFIEFVAQEVCNHDSSNMHFLLYRDKNCQFCYILFECDKVNPDF